MLDTTPEAAVAAILPGLNAAFAAHDPTAATSLFEPDGFWRDLASLTWNITTLEGQAPIPAMLTAQLAAIKPGGFRSADGELTNDGSGFEQAFIDFDTATGRGHGHIRIRNGKIWTLLTTLK